MVQTPYRPAEVTVPLPDAGGSTNLPAPKIDLVGRDASLEYLQQACSAYRLVTLTGTGGIGKTALGIEARSLLPTFDGNVWLVEPASLADPTRLPLPWRKPIGLPTDRARSRRKAWPGTLAADASS